MKKVVDPAEGWAYGFPAVWDEEKETLDELLDRHNYPKDMRKFSMRFWYQENNENSKQK